LRSVKLPWPTPSPTDSDMPPSTSAPVTAHSLSSVRSSAYRHWRDGWDDLQTLWVAGLAVACVLLGRLLLTTSPRFQGKAGDWALYLLLGAVFPPVAIALVVLPRRSAFFTVFNSVVQICVVLTLIAVTLVSTVMQRPFYLLALAAVEGVVVVREARRGGLALKPSYFIVSATVLVLSWVGATRMFWWGRYDTWIFGSLYGTLVFVGALQLTLANVFPPQQATIAGAAQPHATSNLAANLGAMMILGIASVRTDPSFAALSTKFHHWGVYVGPAASIRQGGWLLWDVPSQYGFLSILSIALLPVKDVWESFLFLNGLLLFLSACFIFGMLRSLRPGSANFVFALLVALGAVYLVVGWAPSFWGPTVFPSIGAYRYFWCYALLAVLVWEYHKGPRWWILGGGCAVWLLGFLWSSESAVYSSAIWLPAYSVVVWRRTHDLSYAREGSRTAAFLRWLALPLLLFIAAGALISTYYQVRLGHFPDWYAFFEYSLSFGGGFFGIPLDLNGPVDALFVVFCTLATAVVYFLQRRLANAAVPLLLGSWATLWVTGSYFVSRSSGNNMMNMSPMICAVLSITLFLYLREGTEDTTRMLVRASSVPVIVVLLTAAYGNLATVSGYLKAPQTAYARNIAQTLPSLDPSLQALFAEAGVRPTDPIVYWEGFGERGDGDDGGNLPPAWSFSDGGQTVILSTMHTWLPTAPFTLFLPLKPERAELYMARYSARSHASGWLVQRRATPYTTLSWFTEQVMRTHAATQHFQNADWEVFWFAWKGSER